MIKKCKECNLVFNTDTNTRKFCSQACYGHWRSVNIRGMTYIDKTCPKCGKVFSVPLTKKLLKYCSIDCYKENCKDKKGDKNPFYNKKHTIITKQKLSNANKNKKHTKQAKEKMSKARKGKKHSLSHRINMSKARRKYLIDVRKIESRCKENQRRSFEYKIWRESVFKRDNWTCQKCFVRGKYLEAHHKKGFKRYKKLRYDINNGITVCKKCHSKITSKRMKGNQNGRKHNRKAKETP